MDVSAAFPYALLANSTTNTRSIECLKERRRHDHQIPNSIQPYPSSRHHWRAGGNHHWSVCVRRSISNVQYFLVTRRCIRTDTSFQYQDPIVTARFPSPTKLHILSLLTQFTRCTRDQLEKHFERWLLVSVIFNIILIFEIGLVDGGSLSSSVRVKQQQTM